MQIAIIIPCFNEEKRLIANDFIKQLDDLEINKSNNDNHYIKIIFVDDGSFDGTRELLNKLSQNYKNIEVYELEKNNGKSGAIKYAINKLQDQNYYGVISFLDADMSTPLNDAIENIQNFVNTNKSKNFFVLGSRLKILGHNIKRNLFRHYMGRIFATFVSLILNMPVYDSQCGFKFFNSDLAYYLFKDDFLSKWYFDVELLFRQKKYHEQITLLEKPLKKWQDYGDSRLKIIDIIIAPYELIKIYFHNSK